MKIQDFSENYTCLLPKEIQSLHWTQSQCTVYLVVALRKVNDEIKEDHVVVINDDIKHDVKFVELVNIKIDEYYIEKGIVFENEIESNDDCSSQYKSTFALYNLMKRPKQTIRVFFKISHGKSKSNGLGEVVKSHVSLDIAAKEVIIRNRKKLFYYCEKTLAIMEDEMNGNMMNRVFMYISAMEMKECWGEFYEKCKQILGIRKFHQVLTKPGRQGTYLCRIACMCSNCICGNVKSCGKKKTVFNNCKDEVTPESHDFEKVELTSYDNTNSGEGSEEEDFIQSFATSMIKKEDIAIIRAGDDHLYYLGVLISKIYKTEAAEKDDYQHKIPASQSVMNFVYLELFQESKDSYIYYIDEKKVALI